MTQDIEAVQIEPLAKPWTNRARIRISTFGAQAKMTVAMVISSAEKSEMRRAPMRGTSTMQPSETNGTETG